MPNTAKRTSIFTVTHHKGLIETLYVTFEITEGNVTEYKRYVCFPETSVKEATEIAQKVGVEPVAIQLQYWPDLVAKLVK